MQGTAWFMAEQGQEFAQDVGRMFKQFNKLTEDNIAKIVASFIDRKDKDYFCRLVYNDKIAEQDYNLSVSTYVEQEDTREVINITELNAEIKRIVAREQVLRDEIDKIIAEIEAE